MSIITYAPIPIKYKRLYIALFVDKYKVSFSR